MKHLKYINEGKQFDVDYIISKLDNEISGYQKLVDVMGKYDDHKTEKSELVKEELKGVIRGLKESIRIIENLK